MKLISRALVLLSAIIGLSLGSPVDIGSVDTEIVPFAVGDGNYRLNTNVIPVSYVVDLTPYLVAEAGKEAFTFDGVVMITLKATIAGVNSITLHQHDLVIERYTLTGSVIASGPYDNNTYDNVTDKWTISFASNLSQTVETVLTVFYKGYMRDDMHGFYKSYYFENSQKVWMASTQFEQTEARRAFPCFDVNISESISMNCLTKS